MQIEYNLFLQQEHVISKLEEYASGLPESEKGTSKLTMLTVQFLKACNKMFERTGIC